MNQVQNMFIKTLRPIKKQSQKELKCINFLKNKKYKLKSFSDFNIALLKNNLKYQTDKFAGNYIIKQYI